MTSLDPARWFAASLLSARFLRIAETHVRAIWRPAFPIGPDVPGVFGRNGSSLGLGLVHGFRRVLLPC